ncbi:MULTISPECIES: hypothetical protein [Vibrionaceae]|uniref:hypothetical protein n=1 Tax=Vibrionaceae TaxID=641 RepID=UPI000C859C6B|nr:hypothetical protein [Vibrio splendidus]EGQ8066550.1 hypothetical protein [Vibrio parahaemolyticus]EJB1788640.1 hypothetical protein [Vibrio parahaemolyticus]PMN28012.1 hypothetical protein BCT36_25435 [Vibrio splendidus]PTP59148.1 hypothetical protein CWO31_23770 [Vibrio splendidus]
MINVVLGILFGFTATIWYVALDLNWDFNHSLSVNIVIAMATIVATVIHFDSQKKLRKDRIWDTNKTVLLELAHALSDVIKATEDEIHNIHCQLDGDEQIEVKPYVFKNINDKIDYALSVYRPLMDSNLIDAIQQHNEQDKEITRQVNFEDLEHLDAYETMLSEHKKLYNELLKFMGEISGIKNT